MKTKAARNHKKHVHGIELLAPAGNFEKLETAVHFGADAVYLGGKNFSLRNLSENFTDDELKKAVNFAHENHVKIYIACNIFPRNHELEDIADFLHKLNEIGPDALIVADPGIFLKARTIIPEIPVHLSTQANTTNIQSVLFWEKLGAVRINVARELSLKEIKDIASNCNIEIEAFVHGAMCISYSGRCLLSTFLTNRDSNHGECSHPCRWNYAVVEKMRPGKYMPLAEDERGSYIFNSRDLCMIEHVPEMIKSGISSLKIEGRMKGIHYLASIVKVYRDAINAYCSNPEKYVTKKEWLLEIERISNRGYCTGFYLEDKNQTNPDYTAVRSSAGHLFIAKVLSSEGENGAEVEARNKFFKGDTIEIITPIGPVVKDRILHIIDHAGEYPEFVQPGNKVFIQTSHCCSPGDLIRKIPG